MTRDEMRELANKVAEKNFHHFEAVTKTELAAGLFQGMVMSAPEPEMTTERWTRLSELLMAAEDEIAGMPDPQDHDRIIAQAKRLAAAAKAVTDHDDLSPSFWGVA